MHGQGSSAHHIALHPAVAASCTAVAPAVVAAAVFVVVVAVVVVASTSLAHALVVGIEHAFAVAVVPAVVELEQRRKLVMLERQLEVGGRGMRWMTRQKRV